MLDGLKSIFKTDKEFDVIHTCLGAKEALQIIENEQIDVALVDINMPDMNGIELTKKIKQEFPYTKVIILSMNNSLGSIQQALDAGASGYILKKTKPDILIEMIKDVFDGGAPMTSSVAKKILQFLKIQIEKSCWRV